MSLNKFVKMLDNNFENSTPSWILASMSSISKDWHKILFGKEQRSILIKIFKELNDLNISRKKISPHSKKIFEFARLTTFNKIRIVILGQDPYPDPKHAHGLAFSSLDDKIPPSLRNIYKCLCGQKIIDEEPQKPNLTAWALRGILLLNCALTTIANKTGAHIDLWKPYTDIIISKLSQKKYNEDKVLIFMLWGKFAQDKSNLINDHIILTWRHPSPMAQQCEDKYKFINCTNFKRAIEILDNKVEDSEESNDEESNDEESNNKESNGMNTISWNIKKNVIKIYTDGSSYPNVRKKIAKNGYSAIFTSGYLKNLIIYGSNPQVVMHPDNKTKMYSTNQRAEGTAILKALIKCNNISLYNWDAVEIITDSEFWCKMLTLIIPKWVREGRDFNTMKNPDIVTDLWCEWRKLKDNGKIDIIHVRSHDKNGLNYQKGTREYYNFIYNELADKIANKARTELEYGDYGESWDIIK